MSDNWLQVCERFERTAVSVFNQTSQEFRYIVVCHELPILKHKFDERLELIHVNHPPPPHIYKRMSEDKVRKLLVAMRRVRELEADFVMSLDADDLVSRKIVEYALTHTASDGWYINRGYRYEYGRSWLEKLPNFFRICGSCNILSRRWFAFPDVPDRETAADEALIVGGHNQALEAFIAKGANLRPLPFPGAIYIVLHGEHMSSLRIAEENRILEKTPAPRNPLRVTAGHCKRIILKWLKIRPCTPALRREFALNSLPL